MIAHFQNAPDIGRLGFVEKQIRFLGIPIDVLLAQEETQRDECVEKVRGCAWVEAQPALKRGEICRVFREIGENFHFHGAEKSLGGPEGHPGLEDVIGGVVHGEDPEIHHPARVFNPMIDSSHRPFASAIWDGSGPWSVGRRTERKRYFDQGLAMPNREKDDPETWQRGRVSLEEF